MVAKNFVKQGTWMNSISLVFAEFSFPFSIEEDDWRVDVDSATGVDRVSRVFSKCLLSSFFLCRGSWLLRKFQKHCW